jgi:tRNA acetyltransferase TAN1
MWLLVFAISDFTSCEMADADSRPSKRAKTIHNNSDTRKQNNKSKAKYRGSQPRNSHLSDSNGNARKQPTFSASGIHSDDVGIFVTSDKGQEKKCLQELSDLLREVDDLDLGHVGCVLS